MGGGDPLAFFRNGLICTNLESCFKGRGHNLYNFLPQTISRERGLCVGGKSRFHGLVLWPQGNFENELKVFS